MASSVNQQSSFQPKPAQQQAQRDILMKPAHTTMPAGGLLLAATLWLAVLQSAAPANAAADGKPYDEKLMRLSEILGAVHYLRELCGAGDGQIWRDRMRELIDAEGGSAQRRARFTRSFNQGYRAYSRTYNVCTPSAQTAITRFLSEGSQIADSLVKSVP